MQFKVKVEISVVVEKEEEGGRGEIMCFSAQFDFQTEVTVNFEKEG